MVHSIPFSFLHLTLLSRILSLASFLSSRSYHFARLPSLFYLLLSPFANRLTLPFFPAQLFLLCSVLSSHISLPSCFSSPARQGKARSSKARHCQANRRNAAQAREGKARLSKASQGEAKPGQAKQGKAWQGKAKPGKATRAIWSFS